MIIKEFLPNPVGKDTDGEYVTLVNDGGGEVNLTGWKLRDAAGKTFSLDGITIPPGGALTLPYAQTKLALNNQNESVFLLDAGGAEVDSLSFVGSAREGVVVSHHVETAAVIDAALVGREGALTTPQPFPVATLLVVACVSAAAAVVAMRAYDALQR